MPVIIIINLISENREKTRTRRMKGKWPKSPRNGPERSFPPIEQKSFFKWRRSEPISMRVINVHLPQNTESGWICCGGAVILRLLFDHSEFYTFIKSLVNYASLSMASYTRSRSSNFMSPKCQAFQLLSSPKALVVLH